MTEQKYYLVVGSLPWYIEASCRTIVSDPRRMAGKAEKLIIEGTAKVGDVLVVRDVMTDGISGFGVIWEISPTIPAKLVSLRERYR